MFFFIIYLHSSVSSSIGSTKLINVVQGDKIQVQLYLENSPEKACALIG